MIGPERTRRVLQPAFLPKSISVSSLSPTMHIRVVSIWNLPCNVIQRDSKMVAYLRKFGYNVAHTIDASHATISVVCLFSYSHIYYMPQNASVQHAS